MDLVWPILMQELGRLGSTDSEVYKRWPNAVADVAVVERSPHNAHTFIPMYAESILAPEEFFTVVRPDRRGIHFYVGEMPFIGNFCIV